MPPAAIRRPLTITAWIGMSILAVALSPLLLAMGAIASRLTRRPQPLILARLVIGYFARELVVLFACGALWVASGAGMTLRSERFQLLHYRLLRWFVGGLARQLMSLLDIDVEPTYSPIALQALKASGRCLCSAVMPVPATLSYSSICCSGSWTACRASSSETA